MNVKDKEIQIIPIPLGMVNVYAVKGDSVILVDAGHKQHSGKILKALSGYGIRPEDVSLIIITHGHVDHIGGLPELKARTRAKVLIHSSDRYAIEEGRNVPIPSDKAFFRFLMGLIASDRIAGFGNIPADIIVNGEYPLNDYGINATVIPVPGHTDGSICVKIGDEIIAGDAVFPTWGFKLFKSVLPKENFRNICNGIRKILSLSPVKIYPGHGDAMDCEMLESLLSYE